MLRSLRRAAPGLFDPALYAGTRRPLGESISLPRTCYTSEEWYQRELTNVFAATPVLLGRADELPHPGSFVTLDAPGLGPVLAVRNKEGQLNAFANTCRHRGSKILHEAQGRAKAGLVCPYHAWTWGLDGKLKSAPGMSEKDGGCPSFNKKEFPLHDLRLEEFRGFLFLTAGKSPPLAECLGNLQDALLKDWPIDDWVTVGRADYTVDCNWKFLFENTSETYHTRVVHRGTLGPMQSNSAATVLGVEPSAGWDAIHVPYDRSVVPLPDEPNPFPEVAPTTFFINIFPSLQLNVTKDCAWWMRMLPLSPGRTQVTQGFLFPKETTELPNFQEDLKLYLRRWHLAVEEDNEISCSQQEGAKSLSMTPGPYAPLEFGTRKFDNYVLDRCLDSVDLRVPTQRAATTRPRLQTGLASARMFRTARPGRRLFSGRTGAPAWKNRER